MKTINPNVWPYIWRLLLFFAIVAAICMSLPGCSPARQLEKAEQRVLTTPASFEKIGRKFIDINPCVTDSNTVFIDGGYDSVSLRAYFNWLNGIREEESSDDGIVVAKPVDTGTVSWPCADQLTIYYKRGYKDGRNSILDKKLPIPRPDTLKTTARDKQRDKLLEGDIAKLTQDNARLRGVIQVKDETIAAGKKKERSLMWWLIGAIAALVLSNGLWIYSKFKIPKLPKL